MESGFGLWVLVGGLSVLGVVGCGSGRVGDAWERLEERSCWSEH